MTTEKTTLLILGGGCAGYTAAIYASRANYKPILYTGPQPGGQLTITTHVENYPGYPQGILGPKMMEDFRLQAQRFGTEVREGTATSVDFSSYPLQVTIDQQHQIEAKAIIIATGASAKWLGIPSEKQFYGKGVSACAICDGFFYQGQDVAVVGGGDTAAEEALHLAKMCKQVYLLIRRNVMRASKIMQQRVRQNPKITILWHTETQEILGKDMVEAVRVVHNQTQAQQTIPIQGFFLAIGHEPNTKIFADYLAQDAQGYLQTQPGSTATNKKGVFAAGDVQDRIYRQAITAAATGCMAALDAERFLALENTEPQKP